MAKSKNLLDLLSEICRLNQLVSDINCLNDDDKMPFYAYIHDMLHLVYEYEKKK
jgi:hypothetical protein